jgi:hypothetical protein
MRDGSWRRERQAGDDSQDGCDAMTQIDARNLSAERTGPPARYWASSDSARFRPLSAARIVVCPTNVADANPLCGLRHRVPYQHAYGRRVEIIAGVVDLRTIGKHAKQIHLCDEINVTS